MNAKLTLIAASIALAWSIGAHGQSAQHSDKQRIEEQHKAAMAQCKDLQDNGKKICEAEAEGQKKVAEAEAKVKERDTPKNRLEAAEARAEAQYEVAKAKCGDQVGDAKNACEKEAKATKDSAMAQAKLESQKQGTAATGASGQQTKPQ